MSIILAMEQNLLIDSGLSSVDGDYELLKALGLIDDELFTDDSKY